MLQPTANMLAVGGPRVRGSMLGQQSPQFTLSLSKTWVSLTPSRSPTHY